jgi:hypothetical protein
MRRPFLVCLFALALAGTAFSGPTLDELLKDAAKKKELDKGLKALDKYFKAEVEQRKGAGKGASAKAAAQAEFLQWLGTTAGTAIGIDLRAQQDTVIQMIDLARIKYLEVKVKKGILEYMKVDDAKGMKRHEYTVLVPSTYEPEKRRTPVVLSLHGRVINPRHPAFRNAAFEERSRESVWNNWFKTPAADQVLVLAPTANPDGFQFGENHFDDLQALYRTLGEALTEYRGDWDRVFLELHGRAIRVACEQSLVFAGVIVRDRVDDRKAPFLAPEHFFLLENLNGIPFCYIADAANWDAVGKPLADALTATYAKAGKPENLVIIQATRDVDGALRGGEDKIKEFVTTHERPKSRDKFTWRIFEEQQVDPFPLTQIDANYAFDVNAAAKKAPLSAKAGRLSFEVRREAVNGQEINRVDLQVTEAEGMGIFLTEPLLNLDLPVTITVNGASVGVDAKKFDRNWAIFFERVLPRRFFMLSFLNQVDISFPHKPEFPVPEEAKPAEGAKAEDEKKMPAEGTPAGGSAPAEGEGEKKASGR